MAKDYLKGIHNKKARKAGERYGIKHSDYGFNRSDGGIQKKDPKDYGKDVAKAAMNDYDTRRTIEAAAMSGKKKAEKYAKNGFSNLTDVTKANNMFAKMHKRQGNGGDFSSNSDYAGLTYKMVQRDRNKLKDSMSVGEQEEAAKSPEEPYQESDELSNARKTVEDYDNKDFNVYNRGNATGATDASEAGDGDGQRKQAAQSFFDKYKLDVKAKANFQPTL
jgi:hypothetical protein